MKEQTRQRLRIARMVTAALFCALVFVSNLLSVPIPTPFGNTRLHLGNVFCLLSGIMLGPLRGGAAAGIGSMLYDFTNPIFVASAPTTLINKFAMAFVCGIITSRVKAKNQFFIRTLGATAGAVTYIVLYLSKSYIEGRWFKLLTHDAAITDLLVKLPVSAINGLLAVVVSVPLALALGRAARNTGVVGKTLNTW